MTDPTTDDLPTRLRAQAFGRPGLSILARDLNEAADRIDRLQDTADEREPYVGWYRQAQARIAELEADLAEVVLEAADRIDDLEAANGWNDALERRVSNGNARIAELEAENERYEEIRQRDDAVIRRLQSWDDDAEEMRAQFSELEDELDRERDDLRAMNAIADHHAARIAEMQAAMADQYMLGYKAGLDDGFNQ